MYNLVSMAVLDCGNNLLEEAARLVFGHLDLFNNVIEELCASILHDHDDVGRRCNDLVQFDNVGMSQQLEVLDFPADPTDHVQHGDPAPVDDFHCDRVAGDGMHGNW